MIIALVVVNKGSLKGTLPLEVSNRHHLHMNFLPRSSKFVFPDYRLIGLLVDWTNECIEIWL